MAKISDVRNLSPEIAKLIANADGKTSLQVRKNVSDELQKMLRGGKITKEEFNNAKKIADSDIDTSISSAVAAKNRINDSVEKQQLNDPRAQKIMDESGLCIDDLYCAAQKYAGDENQVSYTYLKGEERRKAMNGEETSSELHNIRNELNQCIKDAGGDKVLSEGETIKLMKGLGLDVEKPVAIPFAFAAFAVFRQEKASDDQRGDGGQGSVTNKAEAKMAALNEAANKVKPDEE